MRNGNVAQKQGERGVVTLFSAAALMCLIIPVVGLAIDGGTLYAVKAKLQAAVDAAALSSARSFNEGLNLTSQETAATSAATRWFHADMPNNWMNVGTVSDPVVTFPAAPPKTIVVNVVGTVNAPTYFMNIFNIHTFTFSATGQASRRFVNIMLVIDRSGSIYESGSCSAVASAAQTFVSQFVNGQDRLGMITFGTDYRVDYAPSTSFGSSSPTLYSMLSSLYCYGYTNSAAAYWAAYQQLVALNDTGALNVILFFTDGVPNTITFGMYGTTDNRLPIRTVTSTSTWTDPYGYGFNDANKSGCKDSSGKTNTQSGWNPTPFSGVLTPVGAVYQATPATLSYPVTAATDAVKITTNGGCAIDTYFSSNFVNVAGGSPSRNIAGPGFTGLFDIAYIPDQDVNGNLTGAGYGGTSAYATVQKYGSGFPAAWQGHIRVDNLALCGSCSNLAVSDQISLVGDNVLDNAAQRVRAESVANGLDVYTYTIGLGNAPGGVDNTLLERVANDSSANNYNSAQPVGEYVYSPTAAELQQAFSEIASQVLRLSK